MDRNDKQSYPPDRVRPAEIPDSEKLHCHHNEDKVDGYSQQKEQENNHLGKEVEYQDAGNLMNI